MPTTIAFALPAKRTQSTLDTFKTPLGLGILMLWAVVMLSIGANACFGTSSPSGNDSSEIVTLM